VNSPLFLWGVSLRFKTGDIDEEVKYKPAGNELLLPKPEIRMRSIADGKLVQQVRVVAQRRFQWRGKDLASEIKLIDPETQQPVPSSEALEVMDHYKYKFLDEAGNELKEDDIQHYAVNPETGAETPVQPWERTKVIEVPEDNWVDSTVVDAFLITNVYEIFSEEPEVAKKLFEEAEKRLKKDQVGITTFSFGGFIQYYCFLVPMMKDGKFVWLMKLTDKKLAYNHLQEPPTEVKVPIREGAKLETLPPVQALVVAVAAKKKKGSS